MTIASTPPSRRFTDLNSERGILRFSILLTILVSALGILFGIVSGSFSILFDGVYSLVDVVMTSITLIVVNLIAMSAVQHQPPSKLQERFSMGLWHLEPMLLTVNGAIFMVVLLYALFNTIITILNGGRELEFGWAIAYAGVTSIICALASHFATRANRKVQSDFVKLDIASWNMSLGISAALLAAFTFGYFVQDTRLEWISPYIDPVILLIVCITILPAPIATLRQAGADLLLYTPADLKEQVDKAAESFIAKHGFLDWQAYVARIGRAKQIEIYFIVPADFPAKTIAYWDGLRDEFGEIIGDDTPDRWLTIAFTADRSWAD